MVNSRAKGNKAERDICKLLSKHFNDKFERRSMGLAGADIICPDWFKYSVEVKNHKSLKCKHLWQPTKELFSFWHQAKQQAKDTGKTPLLLTKIDTMWFAITPDSVDNYPFAAVAFKAKIGPELIYIERLDSFMIRYLSTLR